MSSNCIIVCRRLARFAVLPQFPMSAALLVPLVLHCEISIIIFNPTGVIVEPHAKQFARVAYTHHYAMARDSSPAGEVLDSVLSPEGG